MPKFAGTIRRKLEDWAADYDARTRLIPEYAALPEALTRELACEDLSLLAACLEKNDAQLFLERAEERAAERLQQGFPPRSLLSALAALEDVLFTNIDDLQAAKLLRVILNQARAAVTQKAEETWQSTTARTADRTRALLDAIPDMMFRLDSDGIFLDFKAERGAELIMPPDIFLGKKVVEVLPPNIAEPTLQYMSLVLESGQVHSFEYQFQPPGHALEWYEARLSKSGEREVISVIRNVTERHKAEAEQARLRAILESTTDFIAVASPQGTLLYVNKAARDLLGIDDHVDVTQIPITITQPAWASEYGQQVALPEAVQFGVWRGESAMLRSDGVEVPIAQTIMAHKSPIGDLEYISTIAHDISSIKQREQESQEALQRRSRQVQITTQVAQAIANAADLEDLYHRVVTEIKEQFDFYHTQILRFDPHLNAVVLVAGYGEVGSKMLAAGHQMQMGVGLIGQAALSGDAQLRSNVADDPNWRSHPLLPETCSEVAVPIKLGNQVLGVLDVQASQRGQLEPEDQLMLEGLCGQIAIAIESTRLRQEMEASLKELNALYRASSQQGWQALLGETGAELAYSWTQHGLQPVGDQLLPVLSQAMTANQWVQAAGEQPLVAAPLAVRGGQVIGALGVVDDPNNPLSPEDLELVERISDQVALALDSARMFGQTQNSLAETQRLYKITAELSTASSLEDVLITIMQPGIEAGAVTGQLVTFEADANGEPVAATVQAEWNPTPSIPSMLGAHFNLTDFPLAKMWLGNDLLFISNDIMHDERIAPEMLPLFEAQSVRAHIELPLRSRGQWLGVVILTWNQVYEFSEAETRLYKLLAEQAANVVENRLLFQRTQSALEEAETLYLTTSRMVGANSVQEVLVCLVEGIDIPEVDRALLALFNRDVQGEVQSMTVHANWRAGEVPPPASVGTVFDRKILPPPIFNRLMTPDAIFMDQTEEGTRKRGIESMAVLPLWAGTQQIGVVLLEATRPHHFSEDDKRPALSLAQQMAITIQTQHYVDQIRRSQADLAEAMNVANLAYWEFEIATNTFILNDQWYRVFRTTVEKEGSYQLSMEQFGERFMFPEAIESSGPRLAAAMGTDDPNFEIETEMRVRLGDGSEGYMQMTIRVQKNAQGQTVKLYGTNQDITARKLADMALQESEEFNKRLFESSLTPVVVMDAETALYVDLNPAAAHIYGYASREEVIGKSPLDVSAPFQYDGTESSVAAVSHIQACLEYGSHQFEWLHQRPNGAQWDAAVYLMAFDARGKKFIQFSLRDITESRRSAALLKKRADELATVAKVSTTVTTLLDQQQIIQSVVDLAKESFDLYHAHIYLLNEREDALVLAAGSGEVGRLLVSQGWEIPLTRERSIVTRAARARQGVIVNDVQAELGYMPNPLLPDTRAEMAIPMIAANRLIGVLDVQSDVAGRFTEEDARIEETLAAQVAVALQNVRTYERAQRQAEFESMINAISQKIQTTTTVEGALQVAVRELGRALGAPRTSVQLHLKRSGPGGDTQSGQS